MWRVQEIHFVQNRNFVYLQLSCQFLYFIRKKEKIENQLYKVFIIH